MSFRVNYLKSLISIVIVFALLADFLFLPPLLLNLDKKKEYQSGENRGFK